MVVILEALTEALFWLIFPNHDHWLLETPESVNLALEKALCFRSQGALMNLVTFGFSFSYAVIAGLVGNCKHTC